MKRLSFSVYIIQEERRVNLTVLKRLCPYSPALYMQFTVSIKCETLIK
uniref:Uncharacterized protein n=1 Tax=Faecalibaculum rodentium TaxID=1702221 RepID=A0A140DVV5_9FIRM|nr:hypothetical protein AALO17_16480 [Faecalibaculum rodentium]